MSVGALWLVTSFSFVVALSGAMAPGPLLTYTVMKTMQSRRRGHLVGVGVIAGHALLESVLVVLLLLGFASFLNRPVVMKVIGTAGGAVLVYFGLGLVMDVIRKRVPALFAKDTVAVTADTGTARGLPHPVAGGILISMTNPYWWVWWATIGLAFMAQYEISFQSWPLLVAFLVGHEMGDLVWYWLISVVVHLGRRRLTERIYHVTLVVCGAVMSGFGLYLGISPYFR